MADEYVEVSHGDQLPKGAIKAMHRGLDTPDETCIDSYVVLCDYNGEACFGRACLQEGRLVAWFPWGGEERCSPGDVGSFRILVDKGRDSQKGFKYSWAPLYKARSSSKYKPVEVGGYTPAVVPDVNVDGHGYVGEQLGKTRVHGNEAWTSYDGKELVHTGQQYETCHVLCHKRL